MKKIYLSILSVAVAVGANAQLKNQDGPVKRSRNAISEIAPSHANNVQKSVPIWSNTFGNAADWVVGHDATACSLDWTIGTNSCAGSFPIDDIVSTTASDGWAMVDSDNYGGASGGTEVEDSWITMANPVDLTGFSNVVVEFETFYRNYSSENTYIVVGVGDGAGNVTWPDLDPATDISAMNNVFYANPNVGNGDITNNPEVRQVNISPALVGLSAAQSADIYVRFHWTGTWGYAWFVDDVNILEQPLDDIQILSSWVVGVTNEGIEYGRTPIDNLDTDWTIGSSVFNFGVNDQTNVALTADFGAFSSNSASALIESDTTRTLENTETPTLPVGIYNGTYTAVSSGESSGAYFGNNVGLRSFEVTTNLYSLDGIDVHPAAELDLTSMGSNSFTGAEDGLILAAMYHFKVATEITSLQVMLATGTVEGAEIYGSIIDTTVLLNDGTTPLFITDPAVVSAADITAGFVTLNFATAPTLNPGAYFAAVELLSNGGATDVRVLDDRTIDQPFYASMIYIPGDQTYSNGTGVAVRMNIGFAGIDENSLEGVSVYPNPSEGLITVSNDNNTENTIAVYDMLGKVIYTTTTSSSASVDLSANGTGVYLVKVSNGNGSVVERVVIK